MTGAFEHDVGWLHVAMHHAFAMQCSQGTETFADDGHRDTGLKS